MNDELFFVMQFRNMLQEFRTVGYMVDKFSGAEQASEFEKYSKSLQEFERDIFGNIKSKVIKINRQLNEMHELLNLRIN